MLKTREIKTSLPRFETLTLWTTFTDELNLTHATQDDDHGSRRAGAGIGAIEKKYTPRERGQKIMSTLEEDSLSATFN